MSESTYIEPVIIPWYPSTSLVKGFYAFYPNLDKETEKAFRVRQFELLDKFIKDSNTK